MDSWGSDEVILRKIQCGFGGKQLSQLLWGGVRYLLSLQKAAIAGLLSFCLPSGI